MNRASSFNQRVERAVRAACDQVAESPDDQDTLFACTQELAAACGGEPTVAAAVALRAAAAARLQAQQALNAFKALKAQIEEHPRLAWVLSAPFSHGFNGSARSMVYTARVGRDIAGPEIATIPEGDDAAEPTVGPPLSLGLVDATGGIFLGVPEAQPPLPALEHTVLSAVAETEFPGIGEVVVTDGTGMEQRHVLLAPRELAQKIAALLEEGEPVVVRSEGGVARRIVTDGRSNATPDWLEYVEPDGPSLDDLVFPGWLREEWENDVRKVIKGRPIRVTLIGPTGVGKSEAVIRCLREAARRSGRRAALLRICGSRTGSIYYSGAEQNIGRVFKTAAKLAKKGCVVVVLVDEADGLFGNSDGRFEGSVDRRVRSTFQEYTGQDIPGVAIYLTLNQRVDSWLADAIDRRFSFREYPRPVRGQMARVAGLYTTPAAMERLGAEAGEFGARVADFLYSERFTVAQIHFHSGRVQPVHARDLHICSPGKVRDLVRNFCLDVEDADSTPPLDTLWARIEREFRGAHLNKKNVYELTFLVRPAHEEVNLVEKVRGCGASGAPRPAAAVTAAG